MFRRAPRPAQGRPVLPRFDLAGENSVDSSRLASQNRGEPPADRLTPADDVMAFMLGAEDGPWRRRRDGRLSATVCVPGPREDEMIRSICALGVALLLASACSPANAPADSATSAAPESPPAPAGSSEQPAANTTAPAASAPAPAAPARPAVTAARPSEPVAAPAPRLDPPPAAEAAVAAAPTADPAPAPKPEAAEPPRFREVTIPAGRSISVTLTTAVASDTSKVEDRVTGTLAKPIVVSGETVYPRAQRCGARWSR